MEEKFMREALAQAQKAKKKGEVPIGAVVVYRGKIIGKGYNLRTRLQMATAQKTAFVAAARKRDLYHARTLPHVHGRYSERADR